MIRLCKTEDLPQMATIINDGAQAYRGVIPVDRWHEPYMPLKELQQEIADGVVFYGYSEANDITTSAEKPAAESPLAGVMGIQDKGEVCLIRHAYVRTSCRRCGIGGKLLRHLAALDRRPLLIGTWAAAGWAVDFYRKHGFLLAAPEECVRLLQRYWNVPERQIATSVVLFSPGFRP